MGTSPASKDVPQIFAEVSASFCLFLPNSGRHPIFSSLFWTLATWRSAFSQLHLHFIYSSFSSLAVAPCIGVCSRCGRRYPAWCPSWLVCLHVVLGGLMPAPPCASQSLINQETTLDVQRRRALSCAQTILSPQSEIFCLLVWIPEDRDCFFDPSCIFVRPHVYFLLIWTHLWTVAISVWSCFLRSFIPFRVCSSSHWSQLGVLPLPSSRAAASLQFTDTLSMLSKINPAEIEHQYWTLYFSCKSNSNSLNASSVWRMATMKKPINFNVTLHG